MTDGPPVTLAADTRYLFGIVADVSDLKARVAVVERSVPELASRLDGRFSSVEAQIARQADHLAQQDQAAERARLEQKSRDGAIQQQLGALTAAEQERAQDAKDAERHRNAQAVALAEEARLRHQQAAGRLRQTVAGVASFAAGQVVTELAGWPLRWRLLTLAAGAVVALGWVLLDYIRTRPQRRTP